MSRQTKTVCAAAILCVLSSASIQSAVAQSPPPDPSAHAQHQRAPSNPAQPTEPQDLAAQIAALRAQIAELQAALAAGHAGGGGALQGPAGMARPAIAAQGFPMGSRTGMQRMGAQPAPGSVMPSMPSGGMAGMGGMMELMAGGGGIGMMGMGEMPMMGGMGSPAAAATPSALRGFPVASRIYHIGSTGFFLDHPEHITLTLEQQQAMARKNRRCSSRSSSNARPSRPSRSCGC